jgi:hypothetical protein
VPGGERTGAPTGWRYPAVEAMQADLASLPAATRKLLFFTPYHVRLLSPPGSEGAAVWDECKRHVAALGQTIANVTVVDFMLPSPITTVDENYWDPLHYRTGVGERLALDLVAASRGKARPDYRLLSGAE